MQVPVLPDNESERLDALRRLHLTHTPDEEAFDRVVRVAKRLFDVPMAYIALIEEDQQFLKSCVGLSIRETARSISFCGHAILQTGQSLVVSDTHLDTRFADNPLVLGEPFIRFYAGHPFQSPDGCNIGTLCILDHQSRRFGREENQLLADLTKWVETVLQVRNLGDAQQQLVRELSAAQREKLLDPMLRVWNRRALEELLLRTRRVAEQKGRPFALALIDADRFKQINDTYGHPVGDAVLHAIAKAIRQVIREQDAFGRWGGEEFMGLFPGVDAKDALAIGEKVRMAVSEMRVPTESNLLSATVSVGLVVFQPNEPVSNEALIEVADQALYRAKASGRNCVVLAGQ